jgi:glycosyltransferase involved in cell wall biosynthesis
MKIMLWSEFYPPYFGGIERFTEMLAAGLAGRGHEISVITSHYDQPLPSAERSGDISIHRFPFHSALQNSDLRATAKIISEVADLKRKLRPDLVHLQLQAPSAFFHAQTSAACRCPTLVTVHGEFKECRAAANTLLGVIFDRAAWVTAVSLAMLDDVRKVAPVTIPKSSCIYNGGEIVGEIRPASTSDEVVVLAGGRLVRDKGFDLLITAFHQVSLDAPTARLVITGDGPERANLERDAQRLGIAHLVTFTGWLPRENLDRLMALAAIVVVPSRWREGFGLYAMEAALRGLPVIATRVGALPELIESGITGILVPPEDPAALRDAILHLIRRPELRLQIGEAARKSAEVRFAADTVLDQYEALYHRLVLPQEATSKAQ